VLGATSRILAIDDLETRVPGRHLGLALFPVELRRAECALWATEHSASGSRDRQRLLAPLGDQVALDLREQAEQRDANLGLKALLTLQADRLGQYELDRARVC
jgi:hypothetical protein